MTPEQRKQATDRQRANRQRERLRGLKIPKYCELDVMAMRDLDAMRSTHEPRHYISPIADLWRYRD